jgi:hypothetical protein
MDLDLHLELRRMGTEGSIHPLSVVRQVDPNPPFKTSTSGFTMKEIRANIVSMADLGKVDDKSRKGISHIQPRVEPD